MFPRKLPVSLLLDLSLFPRPEPALVFVVSHIRRHRQAKLFGLSSHIASLQAQVFSLKSRLSCIELSAVVWLLWRIKPDLARLCSVKIAHRPSRPHLSVELLLLLASHPAAQPTRLPVRLPVCLFARLMRALFQPTRRN